MIIIVITTTSQYSGRVKGIVWWSKVHPGNTDIFRTSWAKTREIRRALAVVQHDFNLSFRILSGMKILQLTTSDVDALDKHGLL